MIIKPRVRGFICVTAHPTGCEANVKKQIDYVTTEGQSLMVLKSISDWCVNWIRVSSPDHSSIWLWRRYAGRFL